MFGLALLVASTVANASNKPALTALTKSDVLNMYINAAVHGKIDGLEGILADDVTFTLHRGENDITLKKKNIMEAFKATENIEQACTYYTSVVKDTKKGMVVKVEYRYADHVAISFVTINLDHNDFKITAIENQSA
jgi:hypothetical protein